MAFNDDDETTIEVKLGGEYTRKSEDVVDPFAVDIDDLRKMSGLGPAMKRKLSRNLEKAFVGEGGAKSTKLELTYNGAYEAFSVVMPPYNFDSLAKLYELSPAHKAAVDAKVSNIVGLGYDFVESPKTTALLEKIDTEDATKKARRKIEAAKQSLLDWIDSCNQEDEFAETLKKVWTDYESVGNGYIEIGRTTSGKIGYIGHIPATTVRIRQFRDGFVQVISNKAVFFRNFGDTETANPLGPDRPNEIIHLKKYTPTQNFYGIPDIISAKAAVAGNEFASRFNLDYFENKAVPRYVIVVKGGKFSTRSEQQILEFFQTGLKGKNHRTLYIPLPADDGTRKTEFRMEPVEAGIQDSSFNNYRKGNLDDILMAHRVPGSKVGVADSATLAIARDADKTFKEQVCRPEQAILEKKFNKIIKEITNGLLFKLNELTLTDEDTQSGIDEKYLRNQVLTPNEVRQRLGRPGIEGGDSVLELNPKQAADAKANGNKTRERDANRASAASDSKGEARQPKGDGRAVS